MDKFGLFVENCEAVVISILSILVSWACFIIFKLIKLWNDVHHVLDYYFLALSRLITRKTVFRGSFKLVSNSLKMKRLSSDLVFSHSQKYLNQRRWNCFHFFKLYGLIMKSILSALYLIAMLVKSKVHKVKFIACRSILVNQWKNISLVWFSLIFRPIWLFHEKRPP